MTRNYLPAVILSAAALSGIGYGLKQVIDFLTTSPPSSGIETVLTERPPTENIPSVEPSPKKHTVKKEALIGSVTPNKLPGPTKEQSSEDFWSSYFQQNG